MKILFLGLTPIDTLERHDMYVDVLRVLSEHGHEVFCVTSLERRKKRKTYLAKEKTGNLLLVRTLNLQKCNLIEKGIGILAIKRQFIRAIKKYFGGVRFDLILYPTPPITLYGVVKYFKEKDNSRTYLMLKDIFPQNAVDIGLMKTNGIKGIIYKYFRTQEKKLYAVSDKIGCMSLANVEYLLDKNHEILKEKVEVFPNCIDIQEVDLSEEKRRQIRINYDLPLDKKIFVYGGNLGKPQDIPFVIECLKAERNDDRAFFLIIGDGTEYPKLAQYFNESKQKNFKLLGRLPNQEFDRVLVACDVGLLFLDHRFTIPNFPSRLLSYMQAGLPVFACTDTATDVGKVITSGGFGWWCESNDATAFVKMITAICNEPTFDCQKSIDYLKNNYSVQNTYWKVLE